MADEYNQNQQNPDVQSAVNQALKEQKKKKKKTTLIVIAVIVAVIIIGAIIGGGSDDDSSADNSSTTSISAVDSGDKEDETTANEGKIGNFVCTVKSAKLCKNWEGKDAVKITYEFTNNDDDAQSFDIALVDDVYQDGVGLETSFLSDDDDDFGIDVKIKKGTTKEVSKVYLLRDKKTPLEIEISELISFSDDKLTYTVELD